MSTHRGYSLVELKSVEAGNVLTGVATTPTLDRVGDVVEPKGVRFKNPLPLLLFHDSRLPVGQARFKAATDKGIEFEATFADPGESQTLRERIAEAKASVKSGLIRGVSIGFRVLEDGIETLKSGGLRFTKTEVMELSLVVIPANQDATITAIKHYATGEAATGQPSDDGSTTAGDSAPVCIGRKEARTMPKKTTNERIKEWEATRQAKEAQLDSIQAKADDEGRAKDAAEREEYERVEAEIAECDAELKDLYAAEKRMREKAVPVAGDTVESASRSREGDAIPVVRVNETLPKGIGFARAVKCAVVARLDNSNMLEVAKEMYPSDGRLHKHLSHVTNLPKVISYIKANVAAGTTTNSVWASALVDPTNLAEEFIEFLRPSTIIGKFGTNGIPSLRRVPFNIRMVEQTTGGVGYWVGQGAPKPLTSFEFAPVTLAFTKVAAISVITEELARFSNPDAENLVRDGLRDTLVERIDRDLVDPAEAGSANVQPASLTNGLVALTSAGTSADNARTDLANLIDTFVQANQNVEGLVLIMPTSLALALSFQVNALGQPEFPGLEMTGGRINGIPVITSQYAANASGGGNLVIAVNAREVFLADDGAVRVDASRETALQMLDNPTNNSATATATQMVSMWQTNSIALRAERFINWQKRRTTAVVYMDDVNWGSIGSPS